MQALYGLAKNIWEVDVKPDNFDNITAESDSEDSDVVLVNSAPFNEQNEPDKMVPISCPDSVEREKQRQPQNQPPSSSRRKSGISKQSSTGPPGVAWPRLDPVHRIRHRRRRRNRTNSDRPETSQSPSPSSGSEEEHTNDLRQKIKASMESNFSEFNRTAALNALRRKAPRLKDFQMATHILRHMNGKGEEALDNVLTIFDAYKLEVSTGQFQQSVHELLITVPEMFLFDSSLVDRVPPSKLRQTHKLVKASVARSRVQALQGRPVVREAQKQEQRVVRATLSRKAVERQNRRTVASYKHAQRQKVKGINMLH